MPPIRDTSLSDQFSCTKMPPTNSRLDKRNRRRPIRLLNFAKPNSKLAIQQFIHARQDSIAQDIKKSVAKRPESSLSKKSLPEAMAPCHVRNHSRSKLDPLSPIKTTTKPESSLSKSLFETNDSSYKKHLSHPKVGSQVLKHPTRRPQSNLSRSLFETAKVDPKYCSSSLQSNTKLVERLVARKPLKELVWMPCQETNDKAQLARCFCENGKRKPAPNNGGGDKHALDPEAIPLWS